MNIQNQIITINNDKLKSEMCFFQYEKTEKSMLLRNLFTLISRERDKKTEKVLRDLGYEIIEFNKCFGYINLSIVEDVSNGQVELKKGDLVLTQACLKKYSNLLIEKDHCKNEIIKYVIKSEEVQANMLLLPFLYTAIRIYYKYDIEYEEKFLLVGDSLVMKLLKIVVNEYMYSLRHIRDISQEMMSQRYLEEAVFYIETQMVSLEEADYLKQKNITVYDSGCINFELKNCNDRELRSEAERLLSSRSLNLNEFIGYHVHPENLEMILGSLKNRRDNRMLVLDW